MTNIENSRNCLRRIIHDDKEISNQSIINVIERFVKTVNLMDQMILVPSRLMDSKVGDSNDTVKPAVEKTYHHHHHHHQNKKKSSNNIHDCLENTDLHELYLMLNSVKVDLLWGRNGQEEETTETNNKKNNQICENNTRTDVVSVTETNNNLSAPQQTTTTTTTNTATTTESRKSGHVRQPSTVSLSSSNSSTISDSESEVSSNENDSGIESENQQNKGRSNEVSKQFRTHLLGLYKSLEEMTEAARYLTARYQSDMGVGGC
ncbi:mid1-interacting protein 1-B [Chironomus tepperi]|uniref:mid1-interacting protein 1-B n=1 Tax=Chironomus tepperi TaxID=113505 RepID=UPI00391F8EC6